jgi:hypothetical protein
MQRVHAYIPVSISGADEMEAEEIVEWEKRACWGRRPSGMIADTGPRGTYKASTI